MSNFGPISQTLAGSKSQEKHRGKVEQVGKQKTDEKRNGGRQNVEELPKTRAVRFFPRFNNVATHKIVGFKRKGEIHKIVRDEPIHWPEMDVTFVVQDCSERTVIGIVLVNS